jgi:hypothetical protein
MAPVPAAAPTTTTPALAAALVVAAAAAVACGPRPGAEPLPTAATERAAFVIAAADAGTLARAIDALDPLGGERLAAIGFGFGAGEPWPVADYAARGLRADAPIGLAFTGDGVAIRWAQVADPAALARALDAVPGAARWRTDDGVMWKIGGEIAVAARDRVGLVAGGAASRRDQVALALGSGALDVALAPPAGALAVEADGAFVIGALVAAPGPLLARLGADLGRIALTMTAAPDEVAFTLAVRPAPGTLAERLCAGAAGRGIIAPMGPAAFATALAPDDAAALLAELGPAHRVDVAALLRAPGTGAPSPLTGQLAFGPRAITVQFADPATMRLVAVALPGLAESSATDVAAFGDAGLGYVAGAGLVIAPQDHAETPVIAADPPEPPSLDDENTDVPWSEEFRAARTGYEKALEVRASAIRQRAGALYTARRQWDDALGEGVAIPLSRATAGFHGRASWRPAHGTIAATVTAAAAELAAVDRLTPDVERAHAAALAAHRHALQIRAADVAAWDRK